LNNKTDYLVEVIAVTQRSRNLYEIGFRSTY